MSLIKLTSIEKVKSNLFHNYWNELIVGTKTGNLRLWLKMVAE